MVMPSLSDTAPRPVAPDGAAVDAACVARGVSRLLLRHDYTAIAEVPLAGGRRADLMAVDSRGSIIIVEIKVSRADLLGDGKWRDYLDHCDRFYWAVPHGFDVSPLEGADFLPDRAGLFIADRYDAALLREAASHPLPAPRRKKVTLSFARRAARRLIQMNDPDAESAV